MRWIALLLLSGLVALGSPSPALGRDLKVVSFNVWGVPFGVAPHRDARVAALGPALARLKPDVIALQEVWLPENGETLKASLGDAGFPHFVHQSDGFMGSGLVIASRYPFEVETFEAFRLSGKPHKIWHADWYARKGVLVVRLETPDGMVRLANTHLQARYGSDEYWAVQVRQALQAAEVLGPHGEDPPSRADDPARPPLILCGDLNSVPSEPAFRVLTRRAGLPVSPGDLRIDWVLARSGGALRATVTRAKHVLEDPLDLGGGVRAPLSDHPCVLATVRLRKGPPRAWDPRAAQAAWQSASLEALPVVDAAWQAAASGQARGRTWTVILLVAAAGLFGLERRRRRRGGTGCAVPVLILALLHVAVWALYLGVVYEPQQVVELGVAREMLAGD